jgi:SSS family solute:Na+ symporter
LGAKSLAEGQNGIMLAAAIKLVIPFIIVFPGIMALQLYGQDIASPDRAYPVLIANLLPVGLRGFMLAALFGAVMSSLDSMLNSASTIYTMDLHARHLRPNSSPKELVRVGRIATGVLVLIACTMAPLLADPRLGGIFKYIQMFQGFVSPGIVTVFVFGMLVRRTPAIAAMAGLLLNIPVYGLLLWLLPDVAFLNHMAVTVAALAAAMGVITVLRPRERPADLPTLSTMDLTPSPIAARAGALVIAATVALYVMFW